jgi:hypothetical protein
MIGVKVDLAVGDMEIVQGNFIKQRVPIVKKNAKFLSNRAVTAQYIAKIVILSVSNSAVRCYCSWRKYSYEITNAN